MRTKGKSTPMRTLATLEINRKRNLMRISRQKFGNEVTPVPSQIILVVELKNSKSSYILSATKRTESFPNIEKILNDRDVFIADQIGVFLTKGVKADLGKSVFRCYPNATVFGAQAPDLEAIYNGTLETVVNKKKILENLPLRHFRNVPETQKDATKEDSGSMKDVLADIDPLLIMNGRNSCEATIRLAEETVVNIEDNTTPNWLVLVFDGMLIDGGADILKTRSDAGR